jgi:AraC-type transcriptional regulator
VKNPSKNASPPQNRAHELRTELAHKIASFVGSAEKLITDIPGLMFSRRTAPTAPASVAFEPSLAVVAQGRKRIDLGRTTFIFDQSRTRFADHPTRNGPIWYERSTNMRRHEDWILVGVTAVFRQ